MGTDTLLHEKANQQTLAYFTYCYSGHCGIAGAARYCFGAAWQKPATGTGLYYLHYVYGAIVVLAIPIAITYATGGKNQRRDTLIFSIAALILVAAALRALTTGLH